MKFIHAADIHLDSPLCGLARYEGAPVEQMQKATRRAFLNLIELAIQENIDFLLLAGDLYDGDWKDYNTGLFFSQQMSRLREANIPVFIVYGNHDASNVMTKQLQLPANVTELNDKQADTIILEALGVAIHGQSFNAKSTTENLATNYPTALKDFYNIGLLHTALNGREGHDNYAPCSLNDLLSKNYDYWALGHVHRTEILSQRPHIVFSGNLQGRHVKETGAKGCMLVEVEHGITTVTHQAVDVLRWAVCEIDVQEAEVAADVLERVRDSVAQALEDAEGRPLATRIVISGASSVHGELHSRAERWTNEIRAAATDMGLGKVWVEKIQLKTSPMIDFPLITEGALGELMCTLHKLPSDTAELQSISAELKQLKQALPSEFKLHERLAIEPEGLIQMLAGVEELLRARLLVN